MEKSRVPVTNGQTRPSRSSLRKHDAGEPKAPRAQNRRRTRRGQAIERPVVGRQSPDGIQPAERSLQREAADINAVLTQLLARPTMDGRLVTIQKPSWSPCASRIDTFPAARDVLHAPQSSQRPRVYKGPRLRPPTDPPRPRQVLAIKPV